MVRFLQGINRTDHCRILRNFSRKNKDFKYKTQIVSRKWNPTAFFFQATIEEQNENPIDFLSECIFVSKAHEKTKSFWKGESCTSERKWCGNHKRRLYASSPLALSVNWNWFFADASFRFYLDGCRFFYHNDNSVPFSLPKWPAQMASIIWFSFTSCALYGMDISHDALLFIHEPKVCKSGSLLEYMQMLPLMFTTLI